MSTFLDVFGILLTIAGFVIVIIDTKNSKKEIKQARLDIFENNASYDLSNVISNLEEIKRDHRTTNNFYLLELYSNLRKSIVSIKTQYPGLTKAQKTTVHRALQFTKDMEEIVETRLQEDQNFQLSPKETGFLSDQIDKLVELSLELRIREEK